MKEGIIRITDARIERLLRGIDDILTAWVRGSVLFPVRSVASVIGQIISTQCVFGTLSRLRTRELYACVLTRAGWNAKILLNANAIGELKFWSGNALSLNATGTILKTDVVCSANACTDASATGFGGYVTFADEGSLAEGQVGRSCVYAPESESSDILLFHREN